jgi:2-polyprenyl-3-methyl-5-hydroxy-6-metoxy-1,4-benzoquinol methylase
MESHEKLRTPGIAMLHGEGLEIGAMHNPTKVPRKCRMKYLDMMSRADAIALFQEVPPEQFKVEPDYIADLDRDRLETYLPDRSFDFVILNHVIEHVANPMRVVLELFRIVKLGGLVVISCPDKRFTFDKDRTLTTFEHLHREFDVSVDYVTDEHYLDFLRGAHPELMSLPSEAMAVHIGNMRRRREHVHVWDSSSFRYFLLRSMEVLGIQATCTFETDGEKNGFEYFSVWRLASDTDQGAGGTTDVQENPADRKKPPLGFDEKGYLRSNPDVEQAIAGGEFSSAWDHYVRHGFAEGRPGIVRYS